MWSLKLVIQRLLLNKKRNLLLVLQIFLGASILFSCLSIEESCAQKTMEYGEGLPPQVITISTNAPTETDGLDLDDYTYIKESLLPENYTPAYSVSTAIYVRSNGAEQRIPVLFVSDEYMMRIVGLTNCSTDGYYMGEKLADVFNSNTLEVIYGDFAYNKEKKELFGHPINTYSIPNVSTTAQMAKDQYVNVETEDDLTFSNTVFLPLMLYKQYEKEIDGSHNLYIIPEKNDDPAIDRICGIICKELTQRHPSVSYSYSNDLADLTKNSTEQLRNAALFKTVSIIMIVILFLELIGQFMLIAFKRQRSFAIARMCGAESNKLVRELFAEIAILASIGALSGIAIAVLIIPVFSTQLYNVWGSARAAAIVYGLFLMIATVTVLFCLPTIAKSTPVNILRNHDE